MPTIMCECVQANLCVCVAHCVHVSVCACVGVYYIAYSLRYHHVISVYIYTASPTVLTMQLSLSM